MLPVWRERYLADRNARIARLLTNPNKTETERFWDAEELIHKEAKTLRRCLDGTSRSRMFMHLIEMRAVGMVTQEDFADFSAELREQLFQDRLGRR